MAILRQRQRDSKPSSVQWPFDLEHEAQALPLNFLTCKMEITKSGVDRRI